MCRARCINFKSKWRWMDWEECSVWVFLFYHSSGTISSCWGPNSVFNSLDEWWNNMDNPHSRVYGKPVVAKTLFFFSFLHQFRTIDARDQRSNYIIDNVTQIRKEFRRKKSARYCLSDPFEETVLPRMCRELEKNQLIDHKIEYSRRCYSFTFTHAPLAGMYTNTHGSVSGIVCYINATHIVQIEIKRTARTPHIPHWLLSTTKLCVWYDRGIYKTFLFSLCATLCRGQASERAALCAGCMPLNQYGRGVYVWIHSLCADIHSFGHTASQPFSPVVVANTVVKHAEFLSLHTMFTVYSAASMSSQSLFHLTSHSPSQINF